MIVLLIGAHTKISNVHFIFIFCDYKKVIISEI